MSIPWSTASAANAVGQRWIDDQLGRPGVHPASLESVEAGIADGGPTVIGDEAAQEDQVVEAEIL